MKEMLTNFHKQQAIWAVVLGLGLSLAIVAGYTYDMTTFCSMTAISALLLLILFIVLAFGFYLLLVYVTCRTKVTIKKHSWKPTRRDIVIAIVVMAVPQFIMWAIAAPGVYSHDGPYHVLQVINPDNTLQLKNNHSVLYSLLLGSLRWVLFSRTCLDLVLA